MVSYFGDFAEDATVYIPFNTFSSDDPAASITITDLVAGDIKVHKAGHVDQIVTDGATIVINFDGITGNHLITIDTSVDAAYETGKDYQVRIEGTTVDGATINAWIGQFSIERAGGVLALLKAGTVDVNAKTITNGIIVGDTLAASACTKIIDDFEEQSQADPTGFHVNVKEVNGTSQTANDNSADINTLIDNQGNWATAAGFSTHDAAAVKTVIEANGGKIDHLWEMTEDDAGTRRLTENALEKAPSGSGGAGAISWTYTLTELSTGNPISGADVWATTDEAGTDIVASGVTDASGEVTFYLDATSGTYYVWRQLAGWNFTNPTETGAIS